MPIYENRGSYLFVKIVEPFSVKFVRSLLQEFISRCDQEHLDKALVDASFFDDPISIWDRFQTGTEYIQVVGSKIKVAVVAQPHLIDLTLENVIANRTGKLKVFDRMESALQWLKVGE